MSRSRILLIENGIFINIFQKILPDSLTNCSVHTFIMINCNYIKLLQKIVSHTNLQRNIIMISVEKKHTYIIKMYLHLKAVHVECKCQQKSRSKSNTRCRRQTRFVLTALTDSGFVTSRLSLIAPEKYITRNAMRDIGNYRQISVLSDSGVDKDARAIPSRSGPCIFCYFQLHFRVFYDTNYCRHVFSLLFIRRGTFLRNFKEIF